MNDLPIENPYLPANHQDAGNEPLYDDEEYARTSTSKSTSVSTRPSVNIARKIDYTELYITLSVFLIVSLAVILLVAFY